MDMVNMMDKLKEITKKEKNKAVKLKQNIINNTAFDIYK